MSDSPKRQDPIRAPRQARSQKRVELILETAKQLIEENGCAGLKMSQLASTAGITMGSIYQYFPNKNAIIEALCESYLAENRQTIQQAFDVAPDSLEELAHVTTDLLEEYYALHRDDPIMRDIWAVYGKDQAIQGIDADDTAWIADHIYTRCEHLFDTAKEEEVRETLYLILSYGGASVSVAVHHNRPKGRLVMEQAKRMLYAAFEAGIKPMAASPQG